MCKDLGFGYYECRQHTSPLVSDPLVDILLRVWHRLSPLSELIRNERLDDLKSVTNIAGGVI